MNIIVPNTQIQVAARSTVGLKGFLRLQTRNKFSGKITQDTGWFPNTILTSGRQIMADRSDWMNYCQVGTDNTPSSQSDTSMLGYVAGTSDVVSTITGQSATAPYYGWKRKVFRFAIGTVAANLSEAGVGWGLSGSTLISRALILDPVLQTPTTITPLIDEFLEVTYELRYYAPETDIVSPQVTLDGVVYDTITRAARVTNEAWSVNIGAAMGVVKNYLKWTAYDGNIGTVLLGPSGIPSNCDNSNQYDSAYSANSFEIKMNCPTGSTGWNLGAGIRSIHFQTTAGEYQTQFNAAVGGATIPKTSAYTMLMSWVMGWTERV